MGYTTWWRDRRPPTRHLLLLVAVAAVAAALAWMWASLALESIDHARAYARGHVEAGLWEADRAHRFVIVAAVRNLTPLAAVVVGPILIVPWLARRRSGRQRGPG